MRKIHHLGISFCVVLLFCVSGCGDPQITGTVKFSDGTPLTGGMVVLQNDTGQGIGELRHDGTFTVYQYRPGDGLKRGKYRGYVTGAVVTDDQGRTSSLIPDKYTDRETSGIEYDSTIHKGKLNIVIEK